MGEAREAVFQPTFNRAVKVRGGRDRLTSDAGILLLREADQRLGLTASLAERLYDPRQADKIRYTQTELLRERLYSLALGYEAQDDADRLAHDPAMRIGAWDRPGEDVLDERLASQPTQSRLIDRLAHLSNNLEVLRAALPDWMARYVRATGDDHRVRKGTIDIDAFPAEVHGEQKGGAYNGYYKQTVYHPLAASFSVAGDYDSGRAGLRLGNGFVHAMLRKGNTHTAEGVLHFLDHVLRIAPRLAYVYDVRLDAGFTIGRVLDYLTKRNVRFIGRLKSNAVLDAMAYEHLARPIGRPPAEGYFKVVELGFYQADKWTHPQRVILVVTDYPDPRTGQLFLEPNYFFLVAGYAESEMNAEECLEHYRQRGTFEDRLGEFNQALGAHFSSPDFRENEVMLLLCLLAFNLANFLRCELEEEVGGCWDLKRFRNYVLKSGGRVVKHARRLWLDLATPVVKFWSLLETCLHRWRPADRFPLPRGPTPRPWRRPPAHAHLSEVLSY
jgi:hypothetical protein